MTVMVLRFLCHERLGRNRTCAAPDAAAHTMRSGDISKGVANLNEDDRPTGTKFFEDWGIGSEVYVAFTSYW